MTLQDAEAVAALSGQLGYPSTPAEIGRRFRALDGSPDSQVLVAEGESGMVIAWIHVCATRHLESDSVAEVVGLVVAEDARGRGIGRALMAEAERWSLGRGYATVMVRSNVIRVPAHAFYQRLGFEIAKSQYKFRKSICKEEAS